MNRLTKPLPIIVNYALCVWIIRYACFIHLLNHAFSCIFIYRYFISLFSL